MASTRGLSMIHTILILCLLYAHCSALPIPKYKTAKLTNSCYAERTRSLENSKAFIPTAPTLESIHKDLNQFLSCNRDCTSQLELSLPDHMTIQSRGIGAIPDLPLPPAKKTKLASPGPVDKDRYVPSLTKMCETTGLRKCLRPLAPSHGEVVECDLLAGARFDEVESLPNRVAERSPTMGQGPEATMDAQKKKHGRGGRGERGGKGGGGSKSETAKKGDGWVLRFCVGVCLVGWLGWVVLL